MLRLTIYLFWPSCKTDAKVLARDMRLGQAIEKPDLASARRGYVGGFLGIRYRIDARCDGASRGLSCYSNAGADARW